MVEAEYEGRHVVVFSGRRFLALDYTKRVEAAIADVLEDVVERVAPKDVVLLSGMAIGSDQAACRAALRAGVTFHAIVPFTTQPALWPVAQKDEWNRLCQLAGMVHVLHSLDPATPRQATAWLFARNEWMVERAAEGLVVWDGGDRGGTAHTLGLIRGKGLPWTHIDLQGHVVKTHEGSAR
jgi:uncharacterized phage-like protein YoqJ